MDWRIEAINNLDRAERFRVYMHYYVTQLGLKYNFDFRDKTREYGENGMGKPDKETKELAYYYVWKDLKPLTFDEFCDKKNVKVTDFGDNWEKRGRAQRLQTDYSGIYDWYFKFNII